MTDEDKKLNADYLKAMFNSPGGQILFKHIDSEIRDGWEQFISLPVLQKTSKNALNHQARYDVLKGIREWVLSEIKLGE